MSEQITIENLQQDVASLKIENEGLQERVATLENELKEAEKSKDYWYTRFDEMSHKAQDYKDSLAAIRTLIDTILKS